MPRLCHPCLSTRARVLHRQTHDRRVCAALSQLDRSEVGSGVSSGLRLRAAAFSLGVWFPRAANPSGPLSFRGSFIPEESALSVARWRPVDQSCYLHTSDSFQVEASWLQSKLPSDPTVRIASKLPKDQSNWSTSTAPRMT